MSQEHMEIATRLLDAFNRGDLPSFKAFFAADAEIVPLRAELENTIFQGPNAPDEFFAATQEAWTSLELGIERMRGDGDCLLVLGTFRALGRASGAEIRTTPGWVIRFRGDAITSIRTFTNPEDAVADARSSGVAGW